MHPRTFSFVIGLALVLTSFAQASFEETWIFPGTPTPELIRDWDKEPGKRNYLFQMATPSAGELEAVGFLRNFGRLQLQVGAYPDSSALSRWQKLAQMGAQLVALDLQLPTTEQVELLNRIGFQRIVFVLSYIPDLPEAARLAELHSAVSLTFATASYPKYLDRAALLAIPREIPLTFVGSIFPWYSHMDLFNMLPHRQKLRVLGEYPSDDHLPYLQNIRQLEELSLETDYDPPVPSLWNQLGPAAVWWISREHVPETDALRAFAQSGPGARRLTIDKELLFDEERSRLHASGLPVEWVHTVPAWNVKGR